MFLSPLLGILLHAIGGFAAGSFYAPLKKVERWAWESFWLVMGLAAWIAAPWIVGWITTSDLLKVLSESPASATGLCVLFGLLWGIGNLTFGLSLRYLGMALGYAIALGICMVVGTLVPPIASGEILAIISTTSGFTILTGVLTCLFGIALCGRAGMLKESELSEEEKKATVAEFSLGKGFAVATVSGVLSACFAFGLAAGKPIAELSHSLGTSLVFSNNAVLIYILLGGFASNVFWCLILNYKNRTNSDYFKGSSNQQFRNYLLSALGGLIWYGQFFFYGMGTTKLGEQYEFSSWSIHMAFIIIFSNMWGMIFNEWQGTSRRTRKWLWAGIITLILSTIIIGLGNFLAG